MVVVAIVGLLSAIAIPSFVHYVRRSKTAEAGQNLGSMFKLAAAYMAQEHADRSLTAAIATYCSVGVEPLSPSPSAVKQAYAGGANAHALGFELADYVYYGYGFTGNDQCGWAPNAPDVYTFTAQGDLDGDGTRSTFELVAGTDSSRTLYHARGVYVVNEVE